MTVLKTNLKTFLSQQNEFTDYDFEGSGMSVLLDTLAYNTHYLAYNANMLANEMYLDSADLRSSVVSLAKQVGYTPTSCTASTATLNVLVSPASGATLTMSRGTKFTTTVDGQSYSFVNNADVSITPVSGVYQFNNLVVTEGSYLNFKYTASTSDIDQRFIIPNDSVDTTTLSVKVQESSSDCNNKNIYTSKWYYRIDSSSEVYFLQEVEGGRFEVYFGDGVLGKAVADGNIVIFDYINCNQRCAERCYIIYSYQEQLADFQVQQLQQLVMQLAELDLSQSLQLSITHQEIILHKTEQLLLKITKHLLRVYMQTHRQFKFMVAKMLLFQTMVKFTFLLRQSLGQTLTVVTKESIVQSLKSYAVASVTPVIIDPETTFITLVVNFKYNSGITTKDVTTLQTNVLTQIATYNNDTLEDFAGMFRYSQLLQTINEADTSILSNITTVKMYKLVTPTLSSALKYTLSFNNALYNPHSGHNCTGGGIISSTGFKIHDDIH